MQKYQNNVTDRSGNAVAGIQITVTLFEGGLATIYSDDGVTTAPNPLTTDTNGHFEFYAADGRYNLTPGGAGGYIDVQLTDLIQLKTDTLLKAEAAASTGATLIGTFEGPLQDALDERFTKTAAAASTGADQIGTPEGTVQTALDARLKTADLNTAVGTATVVPHVLRVLLCGDSLGAGQGTSDPGTGGTTGWPARMAAYLTTYFGVVAGGAGSTVTVDVRNFSVGGSYSGSSFNRMTQRIQETAPTLVLLMDTPNDTRIDGGNAALLDTEANFRRMVGLARMYGQPVIITSAPIDGTMYTTPGIYDGTSETKRRAHCAMLRTLAAEMGVLLIDVDAALSSNQDWTHLYAADDGIHAQDVGADMIGKIVARILAGMPLIKMFGVNLATDTFARADSASTMGTTETGSLVWTPLSGTWGISANKAYMVSGANVRTSVDTGVDDHEAQADLVMGTNSGGVEVRQVDATNALGLVYQGSGTFRLRIVKWVAGVLTTLKSSNAFDSLTGTHNLRLSASGSTVTGYLNGAPQLEYALTSAEQAIFGGATKAGLYSQTPGVAAASFDNFVVRSLE